jgi:ankyrin repeat protein
MTPLHLAAQGGHVDVVRRLLECKDIKRAARDTFGSTPFLRAAQNKRRDIVALLAPFNHLETLSEDALGACNGFNVSGPSPLRSLSLHQCEFHFLKGLFYGVICS